MKTINDHIKDENKIMSNYYEINYNYYLTLLDNHINNKPLKIFFKKYKKWVKEKEDIEYKLNTAYNNLLNTYMSIEDTLKH